MPVTVLIVDDDPGFRSLAARMLTSFGFAVAGEAGTVAGALKAATALRPDAALVDVGLPDGDGCVLGTALAAMDWRPSVLLTSSDSDVVSHDEVRRAGVAGFVPKAELPGPRTRRLLDRLR